MDEFQADEPELRVQRYPIDESQPITFQRLVKASEGWLTVTDAEYVLRHGCVISLITEIGRWKEKLRVTYSGGYFLPEMNPPAAKNAKPFPRKEKLFSRNKPLLLLAT